MVQAAPQVHNARATIAMAEPVKHSRYVETDSARQAQVKQPQVVQPIAQQTPAITMERAKLPREKRSRTAQTIARQRQSATTTEYAKAAKEKQHQTARTTARL